MRVDVCVTNVALIHKNKNEKKKAFLAYNRCMPFCNLDRIDSLQQQLDGSLKEVEHLKEARERQMKMVCFC